MKRILVAYATNSGTTAEVAKAIGEELQKSGSQVDVLPLEKVGSLEAYQAVVLGAPMILGWPRRALYFLKKNRTALRHLPLAVFVTCMSLTRTGETSLDGVPVYVDDQLAKAPQALGRLTFKERYARVNKYLRPVLKAAAPVKPVSAAFLGGRLDIYRLKWFQALFVMLVIQARPGEHRNWEAIRAWANGLPTLFNATAPKR
jgi:menaquinone-dependent protoporphyrinogen oxidase